MLGFEEIRGLRDFVRYCPGETLITTVLEDEERQCVLPYCSDVVK